MTFPLLFCIAEEAKPFARKALSTGYFNLAESRVCPTKRTGLKDDEPLETEFIGASKEECQQFSLEKARPPQVNFIEYDIIAVVDARSAKDDTLLLQYYAQQLDPPYEDPIEYEKFGPLPPKLNVWYDFRIDYKDAFTVIASLTEGPFETMHPTYFGLKDELTDERGIFNVAEAEFLLSGGDLERLGIPK
ncbi:hypothetical protein NA57DRAFT_79785 [Rhizodiscina lignyota]|uniref:Uncharacterized protein n=1 Tax=Rhizodiscina lignyota TaxID=1504668 RepID=A0A9P4IBM0_9PEZI|nr:hypothetical protein NA57DRAFT_79785 [Rhizodiscina lignyota]